LVASKSSSLDQVLENSGLNLNGIFDIDNAALRPRIEVARVMVKFDQADVQTTLTVVSM
jgi:hypothetical protein